VRNEIVAVARSAWKGDEQSERETRHEKGRRRTETRRIIGKLMLLALSVTMGVYSTVAVKARGCRTACDNAFAIC
jgi:hypothetical protein